MWLIRGVFWHRKDFGKKQAEIHFSIFIENRNWDLKFVFRFDNENEKRKKFKILFHFKTKMECPFWPTDLIGFGLNLNFNVQVLWKSESHLSLLICATKVPFNFHFKIAMEKNIFGHFNYYFKIENWKRKKSLNFQLPVLFKSWKVKIHFSCFNCRI